MKAPPSYEAYCPSCRVSHPPKTRQCVHCGGPVMRERPDDTGRLHQAVLPEIGATTIPEGMGPPGELDAGDDAEAVRKPPGAVRIVLSLIWIAVAVGISIYRGCQGGG